MRRKLLELLRGPSLSVQELADQVPISRPAVSRHLRVLEEASLVRHRQEGTSNRYFLDQQGFAAARQWLGIFWDEALARFTLVAENTATRTSGEDDEPI